jgi:ADP-heptose:LPS heptosyltransferase
MLKKLWKKWGPNPFEKALRKAKSKGAKTFLIAWNRGLGDIALGLYPIMTRIREEIPDAKITFLTRPDLKDGFGLIKDIDLKIDPMWRRGILLPIPQDISSLYDVVFDKPDPSHWVAHLRGRITPKLSWDPSWDLLWQKFSVPKDSIAAHVQCETNYYHERNWPKEHWEELFSKHPGPFVLLGLKKEPRFDFSNTIDLRGELSLYEMMSVVKNRCRALIAPDSGVLSMIYYLDQRFPIHVISLWADPNHGILKQAVLSPNPSLRHTPVISKNKKNAALITSEEVLNLL